MKKNAWIMNVVDDNNIYANRVSIPTGAIKEAGFNPDHPVYIAKDDNFTLRLTQNGSLRNTIGEVKAYGTQKQYQIHLGDRIIRSPKVLVNVDEWSSDILLTAVGSY